MTKSKQDKPQAGKIYSLTGATGTNCIANGNTWADSEVVEKTKSNPCEWREGKGYEQLQSGYDEIHSRIECTYCMGEGIEIVEDMEGI